MDGGVIKVIDVSAAVAYCLDEGYAEEDIIIDAIFCDPQNPEPLESELNHTWQIYERVRQIQSHSSIVGNLSYLMRLYPQVNFRYFIAPQTQLGNDLDFSHATLVKRMEIGKNETLDILHRTPEGNAKEVL